LGIDFGTTRSVVALCDRGNYPVVSFTNELGDAVDWYPSVVAERDRELRFGWAAVQCASDAEWTLLRSFKRLLTSAQVRPDQSVRVGSTTMPLAELLTAFLIALRQDLLERSNLPSAYAKDGSLRAVVATPANAHGTQRFLTLDAFRRAGFEVVAMLNEPSAAGFEYAHRYRSTLTSRREHVLIYDLGGGTFDASMVQMHGQHHDVVYTAGIPRLGGDDFDEVLLELALVEAGLDPWMITPSVRARLLDQCRVAKEALHVNSRRVLVDLEPALGRDAPVSEVTLPVAAFYDACAPLIDSTIEVMLPVVASEEAESPEVEPDLASIAGFYVVGGASALPAVGRDLRRRFGRRVHRSPYPSGATAIGLAIAGDPDSGYRLTDRFSRGFGVFRELRDGAAVSFDPIFTKQTRIPAPGERSVRCTRTYRAAHNVGHFRYVECESVDEAGNPTGDITPFAEVLFPFDPALHEEIVDLRAEPVLRLADHGPMVEESYTVSDTGLVEVTIRLVETGHARTYRLWCESKTTRR
jgi:molecular chaperone DnaK (HSP70)